MKIVCLGDSLTEGYLIDKSKRWSNLLSEDQNIEVVNSGISGDTTNGMLSRFHNMVVAHNPTHVIIMGGTNDISIGISVNSIIGNIIAMTRYAKHNGIIPIIGIPTRTYELENESRSILFLESKLAAKNIDEYIERLKKLAIEDDKICIDFGKDVTTDYYLEDKVHPNEDGHKIMMDNAKKIIGKINEV